MQETALSDSWLCFNFMTSVIYCVLQRLTGVLLQQQQHVERLNDKSKEIVPLKYRRELPDFPVKVKSLLSFTHGDVSIGCVMLCTRQSIPQCFISKFPGILCERNYMRFQLSVSR